MIAAAARARRRAVDLARRAHLLRPVRACVVRLSRHRPMAAQRRAARRSPRTRGGGSAHARAHARHVRRADVDPEQPRTEPPRVRSAVRGERPRRPCLRALSLPGVFLRLDAVERGHGDVRAHRSAAGVDHAAPRAPTSIPSRCGAIRQKSRRCVSESNRTSPRAGGTRCSTRRSAARLTRSSRCSPTRAPRGNGSTACSASPSTSKWARDHYFNDILQQVAQIAGNASATSFAMVDEHGRRVAGTLEPGLAGRRSATRAFPVLFFDPTLIAVDPPADLAQRSWTVATSAAGDPTFVLAARGARRSLVVVGAGVTLLALSLLATARAARASAAVAQSAPTSSPQSRTS